MPKYGVVVRRVERILFILDAENETDANNRALSDGDEVASETIEDETVSVYEVTGDETAEFES